MGSPTEMKEKQQFQDEGLSLPTYIPIPSDHDTPLSELPRTEQRRRRLRIFIRHAVALFLAGFAFYHFFYRAGPSFQAWREYRGFGEDGLGPCGESAHGHRHSFLPLPGPHDKFHDKFHPAECSKWTPESESSVFKYSVPASSPYLVFQSKGPFKGSVDYVLAEEDSSSDLIEVEVELGATDEFIGHAHGMKSHHHHDQADEVQAKPSMWKPSSWIKAVKKLRAKQIKPRVKACLLVDNETDAPVGFEIKRKPFHDPHRDARAKFNRRHDKAEKEIFMAGAHHHQCHSELSAESGKPEHKHHKHPEGSQDGEKHEHPHHPHPHHHQPTESEAEFESKHPHPHPHRPEHDFDAGNFEFDHPPHFPPGHDRLKAFTEEEMEDFKPPHGHPHPPFHHEEHEDGEKKGFEHVHAHHHHHKSQDSDKPKSMDSETHAGCMTRVKAFFKALSGKLATSNTDEKEDKLRHHSHPKAGPESKGKKMGAHFKDVHPKKRIPVIDAKIKITIPRSANLTSLPSLVSAFPGLKLNVDSVFADLPIDHAIFIGHDVTLDSLKSGKAVIISKGEKLIEGSYKVTDKLSIVTDDADVTVKVEAYSTKSAGEPTAVDIISKKGDISSQVQFLTTDSDSDSEDEDAKNGKFVVTAVSEFGNVKTNVTESPLDAVVHVSSIASQRTHKDADDSMVEDKLNHVSLPSTYEGEFSLIGDSSVNIDKDAEDPSGEGRKRSVTVHNVFGKIITGKVSWSASDSVDEEEFEEKEGLIGGWAAHHDDDEKEKKRMSVHALKKKARKMGMALIKEGKSSVSMVTKEGLNELVIA